MSNSCGPEFLQPPGLEGSLFWIVAGALDGLSSTLQMKSARLSALQQMHNSQHHMLTWQKLNQVEKHGTFGVICPHALTAHREVSMRK